MSEFSKQEIRGAWMVAAFYMCIGLVVYALILGWVWLGALAGYSARAFMARWQMQDGSGNNPSDHAGPC